MGEIEQAFGDAEAAAESAHKAAKNVVSRAGALTRAAQEGNIAGLRKAQDDLGTALSALTEEVRAARDVWRWSPEQEEAYLGGGYAGELRTAAEEAGVALYERDGYLVAYPSLVRIQPGERTVRVDRKNHRTLRPSFSSPGTCSGISRSAAASSPRDCWSSSASFTTSLYAARWRTSAAQAWCRCPASTS